MNWLPENDNIYQAKMQKCKDLLFYSVLQHYKLNIFDQNIDNCIDINNWVAALKW